MDEGTADEQVAVALLGHWLSSTGGLGEGKAGGSDGSICTEKSDGDDEEDVDEYSDVVRACAHSFCAFLTMRNLLN